MPVALDVPNVVVKLVVVALLVPVALLVLNPVAVFFDVPLLVLRLDELLLCTVL